jgi:carbonic anhydrase
LLPEAGYDLAFGMTSFPQQLINGYRSFATQRLPQEQSRYRDLSERGQAPQVMVIGCCDSRVSPEAIFDAGPGELFVVRNVANLVPPYTPDGAVHGVSAALEFAVQVLRVQHIVVLGHAQCGGVKAYVQEGEPLSPGDFIGKWMEMIAPAARNVGPRDAMPMDEFVNRIEKASVIKSLENLMTFPCINILAGRGKLSLHGAYFGVARGELSVLDPATKTFRPMPVTS